MGLTIASSVTRHGLTVPPADRSLRSASNGILHGSMCLASGTGNDVRRVNVCYQKSSGSGVSVPVGGGW